MVITKEHALRILANMLEDGERRPLLLRRYQTMDGRWYWFADYSRPIFKLTDVKTEVVAATYLYNTPNGDIYLSELQKGVDMKVEP